LTAALEALLKNASVLEPEGVISIPKLTLKRKLEEIITRLRILPTTSFQELLGAERTRLNMIIVFLAILELTKQELVSTEQPQLFSDIHITALNGNLDLNSREITIEDDN